MKNRRPYPEPGQTWWSYETSEYAIVYAVADENPRPQYVGPLTLVVVVNTVRIGVKPQRRTWHHGPPDGWEIL